MPTPVSGPISLAVINSVFGRGTDLNSYRGTIWYQPNSVIYGYFSTGAISLGDFYNKQPTDPAVPGSATFSSPGSYSFTIPVFRNSMTIQVWGAGGGGGGGTNSGDPSIGFGGNGGYSQAVGLTAYGGTGGTAAPGTYRSRGAVGTGGSWSGGTSGGNGDNGGTSGYSEDGGNGAYGGAGGPGGKTVNSNGQPGGFPGGGGGGGQTDYGGGFWQIGGGGGGGGFTQIVYNPSQVVPGSVVTIVVGQGGNGGVPAAGGYGGAGADGQVYLSWN